MSALFQFGRCGIDVTANEFSSFSLGRKPGARQTIGNVSGEDDVTITGMLLTTSQVDANAVRQQMHGHCANPYENGGIPFLWGTDPTQSGYVVPIQADIESMPGVSYAAAGQFAYRYSLKFARVAAYNAPRIETTLGGRYLTNDFGLVNANTSPFHAVPSTASGYDFAGRTDPVLPRTGPGGTVNFFSATSPYYSGYPNFYLPPGNFYDMAATIKLGSTLRAVAGRQIVSVGNENAWEISNGLIKITSATSGTALMNLYNPVFASPGTWGTPINVDLGFWGGAWFAWSYAFVDQVSVPYNGPERCVLRLHVRYTPSGALGSTSSFYTVDISLRRGDRQAFVTVKSPIAKQWGVGTTSATAMSGVTYGSGNAGINKTANDGDGNRVAFWTSKANTKDLTAGRIYSNAARTVCDFGIGSVFGGGSAATHDAQAQLVAQYFASSQTESQRVVIP